MKKAKVYKMKELKSRFKIGDLVAYENSFSFNPANDVITVGKVEAIHFYMGREIGYRPALGETEPKSLKGKVIYTISGINLMVDETELSLYIEEK